MTVLPGAAARAWAVTLALGVSGCAQVAGLETQARILSEPPCTDFFFPVYFGTGSAEIGPAALRVIRNAGRQAEGCRKPEVEVVGLADPRRAAGSGEDLSRDRARRLAAALEAAGLPPAGFKSNALGTSAPPTPGRRRADVFVRFQH